MKSRFPLLATLFVALVAPALGQNVGNVAPFTLPLPLTSNSAVAPDVLRARNPWNLPVTGDWKFQLTHGKIGADKQFMPQDAEPFQASSQEGQNPAPDAFDGKETTRWCASGPDDGQWLQVDLGAVRRVQSLAITWENPVNYQFRVEGRKDPKDAWTMLADKSAAPGANDGPLATQPADARYVRVTVVVAGEGHWASIRN